MEVEVQVQCWGPSWVRGITLNPNDNRLVSNLSGCASAFVSFEIAELLGLSEVQFAFSALSQSVRVYVQRPDLSQRPTLHDSVRPTALMRLNARRERSHAVAPLQSAHL